MFYGVVIINIIRHDSAPIYRPTNSSSNNEVNDRRLFRSTLKPVAAVCRCSTSSQTGYLRRPGRNDAIVGRSADQALRGRRRRAAGVPGCRRLLGRRRRRRGRHAVGPSAAAFGRLSAVRDARRHVLRRDRRRSGRRRAARRRRRTADGDTHPTEH